MIKLNDCKKITNILKKKNIIITFEYIDKKVTEIIGPFPYTLIAHV